MGQGTHAWVLELDTRERLAIAREAMAEGFKLVSFDDTSLSFIYRPSFPWKAVLSGAARTGAGILGAGIFTVFATRKPRPSGRGGSVASVWVAFLT